MVTTKLITESYRLLGVLGVLVVNFFTRSNARGTVFSADGKRFLFNVNPAEESTSPITLVVNWMADLKR